MCYICYKLGSNKVLRKYNMQLYMDEMGNITVRFVLKNLVLEQFNDYSMNASVVIETCEKDNKSLWIENNYN